MLFGDPVTPLGIPANYPYLERTVPADGDTDVPVEQEIVARFSKPLNPATVALGIEGAVGLALTPSWNEERTEVTYSHSGLARGRTFTGTVSGQDRLGNPLGAGLVPRTWTFRTVPGAIVGLERVKLDAPSNGMAHTAYVAWASVTPLTATQPITYHWQATGQAPQTHSGGVNDAVTYTWDTPGAVTLVVSATNAAGEVVADVHTADILPAPVTGVSVSGPARVAIDTSYTFQASARPPTATTPITYVWRVTGQAAGAYPLTRVSGLSDTLSVTWAASGTHSVSVTAWNMAGAVTGSHVVTVQDSLPERYSLYLPLVVR